MIFILAQPQEALPRLRYAFKASGGTVVNHNLLV